jgi:hypothetical protein
MLIFSVFLWFDHMSCDGGKWFNLGICTVGSEGVLVPGQGRGASESCHGGVVEFYSSRIDEGCDSGLGIEGGGIRMRRGSFNPTCNLEWNVLWLKDWIDLTLMDLENRAVFELQILREKFAEKGVVTREWRLLSWIDDQLEQVEAQMLEVGTEDWGRCAEEQHLPRALGSTTWRGNLEQCKTQKREWQHHTKLQEKEEQEEHWSKNTVEKASKLDFSTASSRP